MCVEVVMLTNVDFKILFHFASAEGNSTCQCRILGREAREPGSAQAAAGQRPGGRGLQGQCTMDSCGIRVPGACHGPQLAPPKHVSLTVLIYSFMGLLALSFSKSPGYRGEPNSVLGKELRA